MTAAAVSTGAPALPPPPCPPKAKSRAQRQRARSFEQGFVARLDRLTDDDRARARRIMDANMKGWPAEIDEVLHQYGAHLSPLSPDEIRALYRQARRDVSGANDSRDDYLESAWYHYKRANGPASVSGRAGDGRGAATFVRFILKLRAHCYRNFAQRYGDGSWLRHEWFEDQETLACEMDCRRETVNRLLKDPDMDAWVVKIPRRWFDCRVSGGATRVAAYRYIVAFEDPLVPDHVAPIQERLRKLLDARLADLEEEAKEARAARRASDADGANEDQGSAPSDTSALENRANKSAFASHLGQESGDSAERTQDVAAPNRTHNAVRISHTECCENIAQQSLPSERTPSERGVRRSAREEEPSALATRKAWREGGAPNTGHTAQQAAEGRANEESRIEPNRTSRHTRTVRTTADLADEALGISARRSAKAAGTTRHHGDKATSWPQEAVGDMSDGGAPIGVDLAGEALLSEEGLRLTKTSHIVWALACNLALDAEEQGQRASGRTPEEMRASAKSFAAHVVSLLAASNAPYTAMVDFVYWVKRRAYRSARRDKQTGARVPWKNPGAYWTSVASGLVGEAERAQWACAAKDAEEELVNRLNAEAAAWERRQEEERQRQAEYDAERARWAQRVADYQAAEERWEEDRLTGKGDPDQDSDDGFGGWQRRQERRERERLSQRGPAGAPNGANNTNTIGWVERLSEDETLAFAQGAMGFSQWRTNDQSTPPLGREPDPSPPHTHRLTRRRRSNASELGGCGDRGQ